jgi:hypothetical protein
MDKFGISLRNCAQGIVEEILRDYEKSIAEEGITQDFEFRYEDGAIIMRTDFGDIKIDFTIIE